MVGSAMFAQTSAAEDITLEFVVWNYSLETIQDNIKQFEAENPGIKVNVAGSVFAYFSAFVPLNDSGLRTDFTPPGGIKESF